MKNLKNARLEQVKFVAGAMIEHYEKGNTKEFLSSMSYTKKDINNDSMSASDVQEIADYVAEKMTESNFQTHEMSMILYLVFTGKLTSVTLPNGTQLGIEG